MATETPTVPYTSAIFSADAREALPYQMHESDGTGKPLVKHGKFGADLVRFAAGEGVRMHTHEGAHILFCLKGEGWVDYGPEPRPLAPGLCYLVPSQQPHAIRADTDLLLIAVGDDHRPVDSTERLTVVE